MIAKHNDQHEYMKLHFQTLLSLKMKQQIKQYEELLMIIGENRIQTFFQPIIKVNKEEIIGFEALNRPLSTNSFSTTEEFYQFLGETDQIFQFETVTRQRSIEAFLQQETFTNQNLLFLNVHPQVLNDLNYQSGKTLFFIEKYGLAPSQIVFEITEKHAVQDYRHFERVLNNYKNQGFKIAIDDVGAGYNSLKTMMFVQPDFIKLDRSFIDFIDQHLAQQKLVELFVNYAINSGSKVIAEGVERKEELDCLKQLGVDLAQGYFIAKPSPL